MHRDDPSRNAVKTPPRTTNDASQSIHGVLRRYLQLRTPTQDSLSPGVRELLMRLHANAFDPGINVSGVKAQTRSRDHNVSCRFKAEVGRSMRDYLEELRLDAAHAMLLRGSFSIYEVATAVGYAYPQTFYRAFKKRFDESPGAVASVTQAASSD